MLNRYRSRPRRRPRTPVSRHTLWRRAVLMRLLSTGLVAVAVWLVVAPLVPQPVEIGTEVVLAAHDLSIGATVAPEDLRIERRPAGEIPMGAVRSVAEATGRVTSGPVLGGEVITGARFRGPSQLGSLPSGRLAVSVPVLDPGLLRDIRPADIVSVLAPGTGAMVAESATVLSVTTGGAGGVGSAAGGGVLGAAQGADPSLVVALTPDEARSVAMVLGSSEGGLAGAGGFVLGLHG